MTNYAIYPENILVVGVETSLVSVRIWVGELGDGHDGRMIWGRGKERSADGNVQGASLCILRPRKS
jgi:hypothetical protein